MPQKDKKDVFFPYNFRVEKIIKEKPEDEERANNFRKKRFTTLGEKLKECTIVTRVINETQYREISEEDLSEEEKEAIFCGEVTLEELKREYKPIAGAVVRENRFVKMGVGYSKRPAESELTIEKVLGIEPEIDSEIDEVFEDFEF